MATMAPVPSRIEIPRLARPIISKEAGCDRIRPRRDLRCVGWGYRNLLSKVPTLFCRAFRASGDSCSIGPVATPYKLVSIGSWRQE